ncbi:MAG: ABC transporter permease [Maioricimonas sp. JB049]
MSAASPAPQPAPASGRTSLWMRLVDYLGLLGALLLLMAIFSSLSDHFLTLRTLTTIANQIPDLTVIAVGMTLVLIIGGIDLSVGSLLAFSAAVLGVAMVDWGWPLWAGAIACLATGTITGLVSGAISVGAGIPSFIVTLGMLEVARGGAYLVTGSQTRYIGSAIEGIGEPLGALRISPAFLIALGVVLAGQFLLTRTVFGRYCIASGANENALRMSGVDSRTVRIAVFGISGLMCGLGGLMQASRLSSADPNAAVGLELAAIAAAVIGGTSLMGGRGSVINTFFGVLIIAVLQTGLAQVGASEPVKRVMTGAVIVVAVLIDAFRDRIRGGFAHVFQKILSRKTS